MKNLSSIIDVHYLIIDTNIAREIYGFDASFEKDKFTVQYAKGIHTVRMIKTYFINHIYNSVVLPPADNLKQFIWGYLVLKMAKRNNIRILYWTEKWEPNKSSQPLKKRIKNNIQGTCIKLLANNADCCVASGTKAFQYFRSLGLPSEKIVIAYDSSTSPKTNNNWKPYEEFKIDSTKKTILYLGRVVKRKGCIRLIQAFESIQKEWHDIQLIIGGVGEDYYNECLEYVKSKNIRDVHFIGYVAPEFRRTVYEIADVFVLPSYTEYGTIEAWGLTVNEALETGTPVIATSAVGAAYDLIIDGYNGFMIDENNIEAMEQAIVKILEFSDLELIKYNCIKTACKYSIENMAKSFALAIEGFKHD